MENRGDDADVAKAKLDALENAARLYDLTAVGFLPVDLVSTGFRQFFVYTWNEEAREFLDPHGTVRIAVDGCHVDGFLR